MNDSTAQDKGFSASNLPSSSSNSASSTAPNPNSPYVPLPALPTQEAADGILFDYCDGLRVKFPDSGGPWRLRVEEEESGLLCFDSVCQAGMFMATRKKWFCKHRLSIWRANPDGSPSLRRNTGDGKPDEYERNMDNAWGNPIFTHHFNAEGKDVLIQMAVGTLGDSIAWLPATLRFAAIHRCKVALSVNPAIKELFAASYPEIRFITKAEAEELCRLSDQREKGNGNEPSPRPSFYAAYRIGLFFNDEENDLEPSDFRLTGLHHAAAHILGVPESENPPFLPKRPTYRSSSPSADTSERTERILEAIDPYRWGNASLYKPYVCIATKASMQCKFWNHPTGWVSVIEFLKSSGYRVLCIDRERDGGGIVPNPMPRGCEDLTGNRPLAERVEVLRHAEFFIGLASGLSWLAWACKTPTVLISGFSMPHSEFQTPYRVLSPHACHGCWNDRRFPFEHKDFMWCPKHKGTDRQFECTRLITPEQVIAVIKKIPAFKKIRS